MVVVAPEIWPVIAMLARTWGHSGLCKVDGSGWQYAWFLFVFVGKRTVVAADFVRGGCHGRGGGICVYTARCLTGTAYAIFFSSVIKTFILNKRELTFLVTFCERSSVACIAFLAASLTFSMF